MAKKAALANLAANGELSISKFEEEAPNGLEAKIQSQIEFISQKHTLIQRRNRFAVTLSTLEGLKFPQEERDEFEKSEEMKLTLKQGYSGEVFTISNPYVICGVVNHMKAEINRKIEELELQILL